MSAQGLRWAPLRGPCPRGGLIWVISPPQSCSSSERLSSFQAEGRRSESGRAHSSMWPLVPSIARCRAKSSVLGWIDVPAVSGTEGLTDRSRSTLCSSASVAMKDPQSISSIARARCSGRTGVEGSVGRWLLSNPDVLFPRPSPKSFSTSPGLSAPPQVRTGRRAGSR
jgi:hypothetical protein